VLIFSKARSLLLLLELIMHCIQMCYYAASAVYVKWMIYIRDAKLKMANYLVAF